MRDRVTVLAPAKLNLALDVVGILPGGYHALDMTMQAISLYERVVIRRSPYLDLALPGSKVKPGPGNTAIKAALAFFHYTGLLAGADITIYKSVPVRAGMAGGSADAAAVLVGLNELYGARLSMSELCALGVSIGADVPFALMGGTCRVQGLGDLIKALPPMPECWFTVVMPGYGISTPEAFAAYDKVGSSVHPDCAAQEAAIRAGDLDAVCAAAGNALEECSGAKDNEAIKAALRENGAVTALMTGSGAAVFGVFRTEAEAKAAADALRARWPQVYQEAGCQPRPAGAGDLLLAVADACIAAQNVVVAAQSLGLGSCYIGDILENCEQVRQELALPAQVVPAAMLVIGWPTRQQQQRKKPARFARNYIVAENQYPAFTGAQHRQALEDRAARGGNETFDFDQWVRAFEQRKYGSDFSREMSRSAAEYLKDFLK